MVDFRRILIAYADHIGENEGISFLYGHSPLSVLSDDENAVLFEALADGNWTEEHKDDLRRAAQRLRSAAAT